MLTIFMCGKRISDRRDFTQRNSLLKKSSDGEPSLYDMGESHAGWMKPDQKIKKKKKSGGILKLKDSMKFKNRWTPPMLLETRRGITLGGCGQLRTRGGKEGSFWGVFFLIWVLITQMCSVWENSSSYTSLTSTLFCVHFIFQTFQTSNNSWLS